jgi:hypothetical protein
MKAQGNAGVTVGRWLCGLLALASTAAEARSEEISPSTAAIQAAVVRSLPLLEVGAKGSMEQRKQCFTCHNQGLCVMALVTAQARGLSVDAQHVQAQLKFTGQFLGKNQSKYLEGKGQGGQVDTAGYALWTLDYGGWPSDETTAAVAEYFLRYHSDRDHWEPTSRRPPSEQSFFTSSYLALRGLKRYGTPEQRERITARCQTVKHWLLKTPASDTEDRVFRLRALHAVGAGEAALRQATFDLLHTQGQDGGWAQTATMASDAYATGSVLVALHQAGGLATNDAAYRRGLNFLIAGQLGDGSWHVVSRSDPFQTYFESGYPHGKDQFISIAAAGWATTSLALALPVVPAAESSITTSAAAALAPPK